MSGRVVINRTKDPEYPPVFSVPSIFETYATEDVIYLSGPTAMGTVRVRVAREYGVYKGFDFDMASINSIMKMGNETPSTYTREVAEETIIKSIVESDFIFLIPPVEKFTFTAGIGNVKEGGLPILNPKDL